MKPEKLYSQLYNLFDKSTPVAADCGKLCNKACCDGDDKNGMYLFPYEKVMYKNVQDSGISVSKCDFLYNNGKTGADFAYCNGKCDRKFRPLACRIFPLLPYIDTFGNMKIIKDPRAYAVCPLARALHIDDFDARFVKNVRRCAKLLIKFDDIYNYLFDLSRLIDDSDWLFKER